MGFFDRLSDFGDREQIKTTAMRIDIGLQQIEQVWQVEIHVGQVA